MTAKTPELTRGRIVETAFQEFYRNGFQGGSLNRVIKTAGTTKGALFHHFKGKNELGYAVVDEVLAAYVKQRWISPLADSDDPVAKIKEICEAYMAEELGSKEGLCNGCPLNNLAQEMSPLDESFRIRIEAVYSAWRSAISHAFERGIEAGKVRNDVSPEAVSAFIVAAIAGIVGATKNSQSAELMETLMGGLFSYLDTVSTST